MPNIGPLELAVVLIIALIVLGPKRLPEVGRSVGKGMREFKAALSTESADVDEDEDEAEDETGDETGAEDETDDETKHAPPAPDAVAAPTRTKPS
jgi:sec-independent protein translocase protein TatA